MNEEENKVTSNLSSPFRGTGGGGEKLLQFIWQFQYFNRSHLTTSNGDAIQIIHPGRWNKDQGPDFTDAKIKIGDTTFAGTVELHLKTSDWYRHGHHIDKKYKNVILHVVYEHDQEYASLPLLELQPHVSNLLLHQYSNLMNSPSFIACDSSVTSVKQIVWISWRERLLAERLTRKSKYVLEMLEDCNMHWEETFWRMLARNFGIKINSDAFEELARSVSVNTLAKHKSQIHQLEALLFGQANLLNGDFTEDYPKLLQREYQFLQKKYSLQPIHTPVLFLRMRPGNFPTIRLAQLAMLIQSSSHLFSKILETESAAEVKKLFAVTANDYWHYHYTFDEPTAFKKKKLGTDMVNNIFINTIAPVLFSYGLYHNEQKYKDRAMQWLEEISPETNSITQGFGKLSIENKSAYQSQALIELKNEYCNHKRCLECAVGNALLKG